MRGKHIFIMAMLAVASFVIGAAWTGLVFDQKLTNMESNFQTTDSIYQANLQQRDSVIDSLDTMAATKADSILVLKSKVKTLLLKKNKAHEEIIALSDSATVELLFRNLSAADTSTYY